MEVHACSASLSYMYKGKTFKPNDITSYSQSRSQTSDVLKTLVFTFQIRMDSFSVKLIESFWFCGWGSGGGQSGRKKDGDIKLVISQRWQINHRDINLYQQETDWLTDLVCKQVGYITVLHAHVHMYRAVICGFQVMNHAFNRCK